MKILNLLTLATAASAAPALANIKVFKVDDAGNQEIKELHDVEMGDFKSFKDLINHVTDVMHDEEVEEELVTTSKSTVESVKEYLDDFLSRLNAALLDNFGSGDVDDQVENHHRKKPHHRGSKNHHKGPKHHRQKPDHGDVSDDYEAKLENEAEQEVEPEIEQEVEQEVEPEIEQYVEEERLKELSQVRPHNVKPHGKRPHGSKKAGCHGKRPHGLKAHHKRPEKSESVIGHVSQYGEHQIDPETCFMFTGIGILMFIGVLAKMFRKRAQAKRALRLTDEEEEDHQPPSYDEKAVIEQEY